MKSWDITRVRQNYSISECPSAIDFLIWAKAVLYWMPNSKKSVAVANGKEFL